MAAELSPEVAAALVAIRTAADAADEARARFEFLIRDAHPKATIRQIAEAANLSRSRVHQIIAAGNGRGPHASVKPS